MATQPRRRPAGTPVGGQFAPSAHRRPSVELDAGDQVASRGRGDVSGVREGSRTPWGTADWVAHTAPGAVQVSTPGHGGIKLSAERNREIPAPLRNSSGWYEEDCEAGIVAWFHPDACPQSGFSSEQVAESGRQTTKRWFPDAYEAATGETIPLGESATKDERLWREAHEKDLVAVSAISSDKHPGMVEVAVSAGGRDDMPERVLLVPEDDYRDPANRHPLGAHPGSFVADPARRYADITPEPAPPKPPRPRYRGIDTSRLTPAQAERAERDLGQRWRMPDGSTPTLRELVASGKVSGKWRSTEYARDGRERHTYYLSLPTEAEGEPQTGYDTHAAQVSKSVWDAIQAPED